MAPEKIDSEIIKDYLYYLIQDKKLSPLFVGRRK